MEDAMRKSPLVLTMALILPLAACGDTTGERALSGAGIGAGIGAAGAALTGGSLLGGAVIGGVAGAATGALVDESVIDLD
jgi:osmotically inducible lipoprotein OsmB